MAISDDPPVGIPPAEVEITDGMVARLLIDQHPDLANLDLQLFGSGWDNTTYRLGANLAIRLLRRAHLEGAALACRDRVDSVCCGAGTYPSRCCG